MKPLAIMAFCVTCQVFSMGGSAYADPLTFTGTATLSNSGNSIQVTTSSNVYLFYSGDVTGQTYSAASKNKFGDKYFATGGGQTAFPGIYYIQNDIFLGSVDFTNDGAAPDTPFTAAPGWTAPGN